MARDEIRLVCEGVIRGRDQRWLNLALGELAERPIDIQALIGAFVVDMHSDPLWMRVNGKDLLKTFASSLDSAILPGGDIESALFRWCSENAPPSALVNEIQAILVRVTGRSS